MSKALRFDVIRAAAIVVVGGCAIVVAGCKNDGTGRTGQNGSTSGDDKVMFNANGDPINHAPDQTKHGNWGEGR